MSAGRGRVAVGAVLLGGLVLLLIPGGAWLRLAGALSADGTVGDPGFRWLARHAGHLAAAGCALLAGAIWQRAALASLLRRAATCSPRAWLLLLLVLVVVPRVAWMGVTHTTPHTDLAWYDMHARDLAAGQGYVEDGAPTAFWPVGYPLFLLAIYRVAGMHLHAVHAAHLVLAYLTCVGLWRIGRRPLGEGGGRLAATVYALCPSTVMFAELLSTETLFAAILVGAWALLVSPAVAPWRRRFYLGWLVGAGVLVKPVLLPWPALALVLTGRRRPGRLALDLLVVYALAAAVVAPWTYRNWQVFGRFVPVSTNTGFNLYVGNGPGATGAVRVLPPEVWGPYHRMDNEAERDAAMLHDALAAMRADPLRVLRLVPAKWAALLATDRAALVWAGSAPGVQWSPLRAWLVRLALDGYYYACWLLTGVWAWAAWRRRRAAGGADSPPVWPVLWSWAAYLVVVHAVFYGDPRYHQALWPLLALGAAGGLRAAAGRAYDAAHSRTEPTGAAAGPA